MKNLFSILIVFLISFGLASNSFAAEKIRAVATTTYLADLLRQVAGDQVEVHAIASPKRDIHFYHPTPKDVLKVKKAQILVHSGLDLETWRDPLLQAAGNPRFLGSGEFAIDVSTGIQLLEIPTTVSRAEGDIHLYGNPHYWLDPENAETMANNIAEGLAKAYPEHADFFRKNAHEFGQKVDRRLQEWEKRLAPYRGIAVVQYHRSWPYFAKRFDLKIIGELEPKPGIPPTAKHLAKLKRAMKEQHVKAIIKETFQESRTPQKISDELKIPVVTLAQAVDEVKEAKDYISMMEYNVSALENALSKS